MEWTRFNPPQAWREHCAATEDSNSFERRMVNYERYDWREGVIIGQVHDENAHFLGGVSGNAGLFSTSTDLEKSDWIRGKSIGLITNHTGVDATLRSNYRLFSEVPACRLSAIFSPEHGFWGAVQDGIAVNSLDVSDENLSQPHLASVPVYSLYGQSIRPTVSQLEGIDLLVYDMQDIGARYYTYISTLLHAMEAASDHGIEFVVADRPNPITCNAVEGPILARGCESFVGIHTVPIRYGLTIGELATLLKAERVPACRLKVAWMHGYERRMWYDDTGLQWVPPSPNMPTLTTAILYPGLVLV
ncbi:Uncharacterized protein YbbC [Geodia barretti]|uniref:Uncharacterized protein YbbC n=1 Tax=Geodia barretti TaxID=519541 RepID=A0AA35WX57_GEOBA|nr:Uncharacterized protein YbbC [Geodia barretti]